MAIIVLWHQHSTPMTVLQTTLFQTTHHATHFMTYKSNHI